MKKLINFVLFLFICLLLYSCNIRRYEQLNLPKNILYAKPLMLNILYEDTPNQYGIVIIPLVKKNNSIGIYTFTKTTPHRSYYQVFIYDGKDIVFSNIEQELELLNFIEQNSFSKFNQNKLKRRIKKIKELNKEVQESQSF